MKRQPLSQFIGWPSARGVSEEGKVLSTICCTYSLRPSVATRSDKSAGSTLGMLLGLARRQHDKTNRESITILLFMFVTSH